MRLLIFLVVFSFLTANGLYAADTSGCININTAPKEELVKITQIGEARAAQILSLREEKLFSSVNDLDRVAGIGPARIASIKEQGLACVAENGSPQIPSTISSTVDEPTKSAEEKMKPPAVTIGQEPPQVEIAAISGELPNDSDTSILLPVAIFTSFSGGVMILLLKRYVRT
ncbi:MAG: helix-hairpin-helix domain-containing protein [Candidatus Nealsonbacteria bacterium]|nr:helix-hairpin-helix domain-containing protein [Candidatus Nealsonbacteria bacterium]